MDINPNSLTACVLFALAEMRFGSEFRKVFRLGIGRAGKLEILDPLPGWLSKVDRK